jgi:uncharacterized protein (DUF697 family)/tellurite resistance protein
LNVHDDMVDDVRSRHSLRDDRSSQGIDMMTDQEREAVASIALLAAFADGQKSEAEREEVRRVAEALEGDLPMTTLYRDVLLKKTSVETAAAMLSTRDIKLLAYELAVGVADSDGLRNDQETAFLARLAKALGLDERVTQPLLDPADALAAMPLEPGAVSLPDPEAKVGRASATSAVDTEALADADASVDPEDQAEAEVAGGKIFIGSGDSASKALTGSSLSSAAAAAVTGGGKGAAVGSEGGTGAAPAGFDAQRDAQTDKMILNAAVMNGALELLPQSLASMAIIPLQMKLVYGIGRTYGYELDRGHVKDLLATMGVGLTGQYLEDVGRKLLGGLLGKVGGKMFGGVAKGATGMAFSFATTWAIGQVAKRYYAGGRTMDSESLKQTFATLTNEARTLQTRYAPQIEQQAKGIDMSKIVELVKSR